MKKTLIALAAVAATGASFAQVTMAGNIGMSWQQSPVVSAANNGQHIQGLAIQDGEIYVTATEDMGGGWGATARGGWIMRGRANPITSRDGTVTLRTPIGAFTGGALRSCGNMNNVGLSGVVTGTVYSSNETNYQVPMDKCSMVDVVNFATKVSDFNVVLTYGEFESDLIAANPYGNERGNGLGVTFYDASVQYVSGPMLLGFDWTKFGMAWVNYAGANQAAPLAGTFVPLDGLNRYRLYGKYDAGFAKFGAGYQVKDMGANQYVASVTVPVGNFTFALDYMARDAQTYVPKNDTESYAGFALAQSRTGDKASSAVGVGMNYNFSKTTTLNASYITYTDAGANTLFASGKYLAADSGKGTTAATLDTEYRIRLMKTF